MINYEMAISEIEMYKKAHESLSENLTHVNKKTQQFKAERDTLIDDLSWYKAKVSRLERENEKLKSENYVLEKDYKALQNLWKKSMNRENKLKEQIDTSQVSRLIARNEELRLQSDTYFEQWQQHKALNNEISQHIGRNPSSSTYKYFRAKLDGIGIVEHE